MKINKFLLFTAMALMILLAACAEKPTPTPPPVTEGGFDVSKFVGTYEGEWTNETTGASGPAVITLTADEANSTVQLTLDFGGNYLGLGDPPPATISAKYTDTGAHVTGDNALLGTMDVLVDVDGNINGTFTDLAGGAIPSMTYTGKIGGGRLDADYHVTFADGATASAILRTEKK